jgi:hypothetical protein
MQDTTKVPAPMGPAVSTATRRLCQRRKRGARTALALVCAAVALLAVPTLANADSNGFDILNRTGSTLRLSQVTTSPTQPFETIDGIVRRPLAGLALAPNGDALDVELAVRHSHTDPDIWTELQFVDGQGTEFTVRLFSSTFVYKGNDIPSGETRCKVSADSPSRCDVDTSTKWNHPIVSLLDPPGVTRTVPATDAQRQFRVLWDLCRDGGPTHCSFAADPGTPIPTFAPTTVMGQPILNCGDRSIKDNYSVNHTAYSSSSVGVEIGVSLEVEEIAATVKAQLTGSEKYKWGYSKTFKQAYNVPVLPHHIAYVALTMPILREYGTFTAQINNTTWILPHVSFDTPDPDRAGARPDQIQNRPATSSELAACDKTNGTMKVPATEVAPR